MGSPVTLGHRGAAPAEGPGSQAELMRALYEQHAGALWSYALHLTSGDPHRAEDAVQETFLRAWRTPHVYEDAESARPWLFTVARRIVIDDWRRSRLRTEVTVAEPSGGDGAGAAEDEAERTTLAVLVAEALNRLSAAHREVIVECYYRDLSIAEAAGRLHVPRGTVKSRLHYALRALRLALQELGVAT